MTLIAHMSDTHLDGTARTRARAERVLRYIARLPQPPDVVLVTGDVVDGGAAADYDTMRELVDRSGFHCPVLFCPGNHDARVPFRENLLRVPAAGDEPLDHVHRLAEATVVLCDSLIPGYSAGRLTDQTLSWLDHTLTGESGRPVFVALHHPPVELGVDWIDAIGLREPERLAEVLGRHPGVVGVLCGHAHSAASTRFAGLPLLVAPGVASTVRLPWEEGREGMDVEAPPAVAFHLYRGGTMTTHVRFV